jgi:hypothetical protein
MLMIVSATELERYMDIKLTNRQLHAAEYVLEGLQSEIESYLRRPIEVNSFSEIYNVESNHYLVPNTSFFYNYSLDKTQQNIEDLQPPYTLYLKNSPVLAVESLTAASSRPGSTIQTLVNGLDFVVRKYGVDIYRVFSNDTINITYTAGVDGPQIKMFKLLILRAASREMQNMHDDVVGIKDLETRNTAPLVTGFTAEELSSMKRWRRYRVS